MDGQSERALANVVGDLLLRIDALKKRANESRRYEEFLRNVEFYLACGEEALRDIEQKEASKNV